MKSSIQLSNPDLRCCVALALAAAGTLAMSLCFGWMVLDATRTVLAGNPDSLLIAEAAFVHSPAAHPTDN